jgi:hypothetical protein
MYPTDPRKDLKRREEAESLLGKGNKIAEKMSGQTTQLRGINTQYESIG